VAVTGGAGFIGSAVVRAMTADGVDVAVIDDLSAGSRQSLPPAVELLEVDIATPAARDAVKSLRPDVVIHAAAQVSVVRSVADPSRDHAVNVDGTRHVVEGSAASGCGRIVFISSGGAVYGEADGANETTPPAPQSPYGRNKLAAELVVSASGLSYANARLANVYGPGQRADLEGGVAAIFANAAIHGRRAVIYGDGEQSRDFVFVGDVAEAIRALAVSSRSGTWNIGTGRSTTVHELLAAVEEAAGRKIPHEHHPQRDGEVQRSCLSIDRIAADIGWRPRTSLAEGLRTVLASAESLAEQRDLSRS
jgi:UDP-glucose 4-epimerase